MTRAMNSLTSINVLIQTDNSGFAVTAEIARFRKKQAGSFGDKFDGCDIG